MTQQNTARQDTVIDEHYIDEWANRLSNWGRWGSDDQAGTLNFVAPDDIVAATRLVTKGKVFSLAVPFELSGPQQPGKGRNPRRWNPIHTMLRDGGDVATGQVLGTDDAIYMPLQCGTQWDSLAHRFWRGKMYNDRGTECVTSFGANYNSIDKVHDRVVGRGVLLDIARYKKKPWLELGEAIYADDLDGCAAAQGVEVRRADFVLIRTGEIAMVQERGEWGDYVQAPAPGLSVTTADWFFRHEVAAVAADTMGVEVLPNETVGDPKLVNQPWHSIMLTRTGLTIGEIFDLEALAQDCDTDGVYEFLFVAPPIPFTRAVGSPVNPIAIK